MTAIAILLVCAAGAADSPTPEQLGIALIHSCDTLDGWSSAVKLTPVDPARGSAATKAMPAAQVGGLQLNFTDTGIDLSQYDTLSFAWKVDGQGLKNFMVKVRNHPIDNGMEAVYHVWEAKDGPLPSGWQRALIRLDHPTFTGWGEKPNLKTRYLSFRTETESGSNVVLSIDDIAAMPGLFDCRIGACRVQDGNAQLKATLRNLAKLPLTLEIGSGDQTLATQTLDAGQEQVTPLTLPADSSSLAGLPPFGAAHASLWCQVIGAPLTHTDTTVPIVNEVPLPPHPRLLLTQQGVQDVKRRIEQHDWAKNRWVNVEKSAQSILTKDIILPPRGGNWWHWYACPEHGAKLKTGKRIGDWEWEHICPVDNHVLLGDPTRPDRDFDACVLFKEHLSWAGNLRQLGVAYQVSGDARYAAKARDIMAAYIEAYTNYPLHNIRGEAKVGGGRVEPQSLDESVWLISMCQGADLIWDTVPEDMRRDFENRVVRPCVDDVILPHHLDVHNIQCWKNSATGLAGLLIDEPAYVHDALYHPRHGFQAQMAQGVRPDGAWWEGAWGYHFYTIMALWNLTEAGRNCALGLNDEPFKRMFDAPVALMMPNYCLPAFNDSGEVNLKGSAQFYELAYARFGNPDYLKILSQSNRNNDYALWMGVDTLPEQDTTSWESADHPDSGYAILANGDGADATWLCIDYGPHGGGHGHPDKLGFVLYSRGIVIAPDPGTALYGNPVQKGWYRTTFAHNTLVVDQASQRGAQGQCLAFGSENGVDYAITDAGPIYDGVRFVRTAAVISPDLVVFADYVACDGSHTLDLVYHQFGGYVARPEGQPWDIPGIPGYSYLRDARVTTLEGPETLITTPHKDKPVAVTFALRQPAQLITATGVGSHLEARVPLMMLRREASALLQVWCVALDGNAPTLTALQLTTPDAQPVPLESATAWQFTHGGQTHNLVFNPEQREVAVILPGDRTVRTSAPFCALAP